MSLQQAINLGLRVVSTTEGPRATRLSKRQLEVARLVASGFTNRQIAASLRISERTAEGHIEQIRNKLDFTSRVQIAAWYIESGRLG
jgi:non-specific serine/threonine protein kinase